LVDEEEEGSGLKSRGKKEKGGEKLIFKTIWNEGTQNSTAMTKPPPSAAKKR
jgi:hypothetical protein